MPNNRFNRIALLSRFVLVRPEGRAQTAPMYALPVKRMFCVLRNSEVWFRAIRGAKHQIVFVVLELSVLVDYVK